MPTDGIPSPTGTRGPGGDGGDGAGRTGRVRRGSGLSGTGHTGFGGGSSLGLAGSGWGAGQPWRPPQASYAAAGSRAHSRPSSAAGSASGFYDESGGHDGEAVGRPGEEDIHGRAARSGDAAPEDGYEAGSADGSVESAGGDEADQPAFNPLAGMRQLLMHCQMQGLVPDDGALVAMAGEGTELPPGRTWFRLVEQRCQAHDRDRSGLITSAAFAQALREAMPDLQSGMEFSLVAGMGMQGVRRIDYEDFVMAMGTLFDRHASAVTRAEA
ncbi:hypothetical protein FNF29_06437 [Cafeteria roenbergensis]|uniref:EF-hand domain-containing protein n=1 Tax=Cafeteria roenbergensis TaxID=33653 RepID=A0A5A8C6W1_CAFRO|nr:hypothetical protein FNF29_06437 [Cafeteria roenbergensis]|eukprot:KAA0148812.1 hypothetical protein FNF29_06437 [Cafeteria roenbergensis]